MEKSENHQIRIALAALDLTGMDDHICRYAALIPWVLPIEAYFFVHVAQDLELPKEVLDERRLHRRQSPWQTAERSDRCADIVVKNCTLWSAEWGNAIEIGYELRFPLIENIQFDNIRVIRVEKGAVFSIHQTDDSMVKNILMKNIIIENATDKFVDLGIFFSYFSQDNPYERSFFLKNKYLQGPWDNAILMTDQEKKKYAQNRGEIKAIAFRDIEIVSNVPYSLIAGYDVSHQVQDVEFQSIKINGRKVKSLRDLGLAPNRFTQGIHLK